MVPEEDSGTAAEFVVEDSESVSDEAAVDVSEDAAEAVSDEVTEDVSEDVSDDVREDVADNVSDEVSDKVSSGRGDTAGAPFGEGPFPEGEPRETRYRGNESSMRAARQIPSAAAPEEERLCRRVRRGSTGGDTSGY